MHCRYVLVTCVLTCSPVRCVDVARRPTSATNARVLEAIAIEGWPVTSTVPVRRDWAGRAHRCGDEVVTKELEEKRPCQLHTAQSRKCSALFCNDARR